MVTLFSLSLCCQFWSVLPIFGLCNKKYLVNFVINYSIGILEKFGISQIHKIRELSILFKYFILLLLLLSNFGYDKKMIEAKHES